ncbi:MAG: molybdopterin-dependent oxidoreductase, partial [Immundisolibacteraceae bacterium]|nr:molybdopterin-dependent oxidoreductase [Immundisolibacteraceae bacterium]
MARRIVGQATARVDGPAKVTGQSQFSADVDLPGMLRGKILRSPYPHARIISVDTSAAEALPGVRAVITGQDKAYLIGRAINDLPVLASDEVRFIGDRVAAVAADNIDIAETALGLIEVEYEELPAVFSIDEVIADDAYPVHQNPKDYEGAFSHPGEPKVSNVCAYFKWDHGDIDAAMAGADQIFEHEFETPFEHHGYLEPNVSVADVKADGSCQMWSSNKSPYMLRLQLAKTFQLPPETFEIHMTTIGGDFGGKGNPFDAPIAYLLSKAAG